MKYKVFNGCSTDVAYECNNLKECIKFIEDRELSEYNKHLEYVQRCIDSYDLYADYIPDYFIVINNKIYTIVNIYLLR